MNQKKTVMTATLLKIFGVIWIVVTLIPVFFSSAKSWGNWTLGFNYTKSLYTTGFAISPALYGFYWIDKLKTGGGKISAIKGLKRLAVLLCLITVVIAVIGIGIGDRHHPAIVSNNIEDIEDGFISAVASLDGKILCKDNTIWFGIPISGSCDTFIPPSNLAVGEKFTANGKERTIGFIQAIQADKDWKELGMKKGEWFCSAGETKDDLDPEHNDEALWLFIKKCQFVPTPNEFGYCFMTGSGVTAICDAIVQAQWKRNAQPALPDSTDAPAQSSQPLGDVLQVPGKQ